ncbi:outer membrane beta-barrel family protein [Snuella lapsa]|uniref:Outer membrane beta-barrel family protein n=1 Tax=Snuella lapsa TaxID=870481 RepID=A0ABP6YEE2_9FLAO
MASKLTTFLLFLCSLSSVAQDFVISGRVLDQDNKVVAYANVVLLNAKDSLAVGGATTDENGDFKLERVKPNAYVLKISFLGFESYETAIDLKENTSIGTVVLKEANQTLDGVVVVAKRPTVKRMVDRLVFSVENSTLSNSNVLDVLKHTPGVLVHDDKITVKNTLPTVYINDRKVHLSIEEVQQLLEGTSATNVKSVEVITNPPAKYEAEGGAVLNIVTSKNIIAGYNGSVFGNYKQGHEYPKYSFGTSHFFKSKKINTYINYNINPRKDFREVSEHINFMDNNAITSKWESDSEERSKSANQNINANIDYELSKRDALSFAANVLIEPRENTKKGVNSTTKVFDANKNLDSIFNTFNNSVKETFNLAFTLDYIHKFKRQGEKLSASIHNTHYDNSGFQDVSTGYFFPDNETPFRRNKFQTFTSQHIHLSTGQLDYELPSHANNTLFEAGAKVSKISSDNILTQYVFVNDVKEEDLENSDNFLYDETNYASYVSFSKDWNSWSLKSGLRVEHTSISGNSLSTAQINKTNYTKFFPSLHLLHKLNDKDALYFNYNRRIYRPRYAQLNPFKFFLNDNAYISGDPNLKPQIDDSFTLGYTINKKYTFELYYRYENNPTIQIVFQDNADKILKYINTNIDKSISYGLDFTTYAPIVPRWNLYTLLSAFYYDNQFFALESSNQLERNSKWSFYSQVNNYFELLKDKSLLLDITYLHISPIADGPTVISSRSGLSINLKKTFWTNKASINLGYQDLFNGQNFSTTTRYLNQDIKLNSRRENRLFVLGFNYNFGNTSLKNNEKVISTVERERLVKND